ncbi:hypothetical protein [Virgibacillus halodenitrificans]|uniref:hypothetical protein n=1 Tax=Virgibacillus halodenitrificans TaxID=1482 RepID=UPI0013CEE3FC|nr:hypothetical protein [Virgibacillus halodenitrificans]
MIVFANEYDQTRNNRGRLNIGFTLSGLRITYYEQNTHPLSQETNRILARGAGVFRGDNLLYNL